MFTTIKGRLALVMAFLSALLAAVGITGLIGMQNADSNNLDLFRNQLPSAVEVSDAVTYVGRERLSLDRAVLSSNSLAVDDAIAHSAALRKKSDEAWNAYAALPASPEEKAQADAFNAQRISLLRMLDQGYAAVRANDHDKAAAIASAVQDDYSKLEDSGDALRQRQIDDAKESYEQGHAQYTAFRTLNICAILIGIFSAGISWASLRRRISRPIETALEQFDTIASGDLRVNIEASTNDEMGHLLRGIAKMQSGLVDTVNLVRKGTEAIASATRQIAAGNLDLSSRTEEQAAALQETASSMEEITGTVRQNADNARQASVLAANASDVADRGSHVVSQVVTTMSDITASSEKIADIISIIESIAFQTNILALNAAVEAARAGEEGRGFAVVAGEVRSLAQRSSGAAKEIKELIEISVERVKAGSTLVDDAGRTMTEIITAVRRVTDIMGEISAASQEQSSGIDQVGRAVTQMDEVTQQNAALVEEAAAAAQSLETQADGLRAAVAVFKLSGDDPSPQQAPRSSRRTQSVGVSLSSQRRAREDTAAAHESASTEWDRF
ncbi:HAMP domain-containing protein [Paraburkholderia sp. Tr-20389]|uniref:methyl-accepting chemotaxis protein n=1 Tax=Paraburkholderia sp. Tr-20389 TaxID=2703903 RepID=UPI00197FD87D|nr:HAMP domain-containing protein [Paraburkholderia sp. Tr-20389]